MDFVWRELSALQGSKLYTLGRAEEFEVVEINAKRIIVKPAKSGVERMIPTSSLNWAYQELVSFKKTNLTSIRTHNEMNPVYIAALLAQLPNVRVVRKPKIVLFIGNI